MIRPFRLACLFVAAASMVGCGILAKGEVYPVPISEVRQALRQTEPPMDVLGSAATNWRVSQRGDGTIVWLILGEGNAELMRFVAKSTSEGRDATRVEVSVQPPDGSNHDVVAKGMQDHPAILDFYHAAIAEQVDARLEKREFEYRRIAMQGVQATVIELPGISAQMDRAGEQMRKRDADHMARAYRNEGNGDTIEAKSFDTFSRDGDVEVDPNP